MTARLSLNCARDKIVFMQCERARSELFHAASRILPPSWCRRLLCQSLLLLFHCRRRDDERTDQPEGNITDDIAEPGSRNCRAWEANNGAVMQMWRPDGALASFGHEISLKNRFARPRRRSHIRIHPSWCLYRVCSSTSQIVDPLSGIVGGW